jgi:hypothetical protein
LYTFIFTKNNFFGGRGIMSDNKILVVEPEKMKWESLKQAPKGTLVKILMYNKKP